MGQNLTGYFCPRCQQIQGAVTSVQDSDTLRCCEVCGFPVESGLSLQSEDARIPAVVSLAELEMASRDLTVPTQLVPIDCWTADEAMLSGEVSLHLVSDAHDGPETVQDRLNNRETFLPLRLALEGALVLLNKIHIIRVDVGDSELAAYFPAGSCDVEDHQIRVQLIDGEHLEGAVTVDLPAERRRLSDYLNAQPAFMPLRGRDRIHLLQKRFIVQVVPHAR